jgi:hypothetical protein
MYALQTSHMPVAHHEGNKRQEKKGGDSDWKDTGQLGAFVLSL